MSRIGVMQVIDTLAAAGAERVAVNLANLVPRDRYHLHLCTTRREGPLSTMVKPDVARLSLNRKRTLDLGALRRLGRYIREHDIQILHAHGTSLFIAIVAWGFARHVKVIWHDHYGEYLTKQRPASLYGWVCRRTHGIIAVNEPLAAWARQRLGVRADRVWYIPNFVVLNGGEAATGLPGVPGKRVACVANLRPQKDHATLLRAMTFVAKSVPDAHLLLVGAATDPAYADRLKQFIFDLKLTQHVTWLGPRDDVAAILRACDIGVLSSASEGLPLALIEYGMAGLAAVATSVGQCADVLGQGAVGRLVPPGDPSALAAALEEVLRDSESRHALARGLQARTQSLYSVEAVMPRICQVYETVLKG